MQIEAYKIVDWERTYEKAQAKRCVNVRWVPFQTKWDGMGFRNVMALGRHAGNVFTAFVLMVEVAAAKGAPRGVLANENGSFSPETLEKLTGFAAKYFAMAFETLSKPEIKWIEKVTISNTKHENTPSAVGADSEHAKSALGEHSDTNNYSNNNNYRDHSVTTEERGSEPNPEPPPRAESDLELPNGYPPPASSPVGKLERAWHRAQRHRAPKHSLLTAPECAFLGEAIAALGFEYCEADLEQILAGDVSSFGFVRKRWARLMAQQAQGGEFSAQSMAVDGRAPKGPPELKFQVNDLDDIAPIPASWRKGGSNG